MEKWKDLPQGRMWTPTYFCFTSQSSAQVIKHVAKVQIQEIVRQVPKIEVKVEERIVEVPQIQTVERIQEVPQVY